MRNALAAAGLLVLFAGSAGAIGDLNAIFSGAIVHRTSGIAGAYRTDVWKFEPGGMFSGRSSLEISAQGMHVYYQEGRVAGRWSVENDTLCLEGRGLEFDGKRCYRITQGQDPYGRERYFATDVAGGDGWEMLLHR